MAIVRGPFNIKWGDNTLVDVEEIDVSHEIDSEQFDTIQGHSYELDGAYRVSAIITLLASDIPALAAVLPQHHVGNGEQLSTGETVNHADGAIDVVPGDCDLGTILNNLDIISCATLATVARIVDARTKLEGVEFDNKLQKVMVKFIGESAQDEATMQFFRQGTISVVS